ncbi:N-methyl-L-tryptophan oxidase [Saxibacter everestensis]|uniref:N-methyl-L-tryptophan oxidase n=1 Tax=Saxibacter everestensis TaxID=2909229 RepID=A0ABY8QTU8_9MICO|nr:N-methyl-L-tryptophan oxidase [Brevibacteriaceae bacterium ZFBP1038]
MGRLKVGVVGLGTMGSQVLWQLSKRGVDATGFETYFPGHSRGAAGGETRLFRNIELEDLRYAPIVARASEIWDDLQGVSGRELRVISGALVMGSPAHTQMQTALVAAHQSGKPYEVLDRAELRARHPQFEVDPGDIAIWDRTGGSIRPELTVATAADLAEQNGATINRGSKVREINETHGGVTVVTDAGRFDFDRVVVAAGGWINQLLPRFESLITVRRLISAWYFGRDAEYLKTVVPFIRTAPTYCYGLPVPDRTAMKLGVGYEDHLPADRPDEVERIARPDELAPFERVIARYMPGLNPYPMRTETYIETYTPDRHEWIGEHPDMGNVVVLAGFSGHGFKMSPAIGEIGAELAIDGKTGLDIDFLNHEGEL